MPQNSNFLLLRGHRFGQKIEFTVMAPNHGGDPVGSILGPMGSHWGKKMGQNRKKLPCPQIRILTPLRSSIWAKYRINGYGAKSGWGTPRVHLGTNGVPMGPKNGSKRQKITIPNNSNFWLLRAVIDLGKNRIYGHGAKSRWGPLGSILGPMGSHWGQKMGQKGKKLLCPKIWIFYYSAVIDLGKISN